MQADNKAPEPAGEQPMVAAANPAPTHPSAVLQPMPMVDPPPASSHRPGVGPVPDKSDWQRSLKATQWDTYLFPNAYDIDTTVTTHQGRVLVQVFMRRPAADLIDDSKVVKDLLIEPQYIVATGQDNRHIHVGSAGTYIIRIIGLEDVNIYEYKGGWHKLEERTISF